MHHDDDWQRNAREAAPPGSQRPSMTPEHSPVRFTRCRDRACRRHRRCASPGELCANRRWPLLRTHARQDAAMARIEHLTNELLRQRGMQP